MHDSNVLVGAGVKLINRIFAATAASIFSPTPSPGVSGTSSPLPSHAAHTSTRSWQTTTFSNGQAASSSATTNANSTVLPPVRAKTAGAPSTAARVGKEMARRGLYSRFLRGKVIVVEPEEEEVIAGSSTIPDPSTSKTVDSVPKSKKGKEKEREKKREDETKEERRARRAEKAKRKEEKAAKKASTGLGEGEGVVPVQEDEGRSKKKKRKAEEDLAGPSAEKVGKKAKKDKKIRVDGEVEGDQAKKEKKERKGKKGKKD